MSDTGTDADDGDTDTEETAGNLSKVTGESVDAEATASGESDAAALHATHDEGNGDSDSDGGDEAEGSTDSVDEGEIDAGIDLDDDGEPDITLRGRGPLQTVLIFVLVLFALDVAFNGGDVTTAILEALVDTASL